MIRYPVLDNVSGTTTWMFLIDVEEATRYAPGRHVQQSGPVPPKKNPGGRGP